VAGTISKKKKRGAKKTSEIRVRNKPLSKLTDEALRSYFTTLNGHRPAALYQLVMGEVEKPLLRAVLDYTGGNQSEAADILGINRGTLRKKLRDHNLPAK
jgi:Fis family transcriptional regulator